MKKLDIIQINSILQQVNLSALTASARKEIILLATELSPIVKAYNDEKQQIQDKLFENLNVEEYVKDTHNPKFEKERNAERELVDILNEKLKEDVIINRTLSQDTIIELPSALDNCTLSIINYLNTI